MQWDDKSRTKMAIGMSPFQLVYGAEVFFLASLGVPVTKLLQVQQDEPSHMQRIINQII